MLLLKRIVGVVLAAVTLIVAFFFSVVILAVVLAGALIAVGYFWWKTRALRRAANAGNVGYSRNFGSGGGGGRTIEATEVYEVPNDVIEEKTKRPPP